MTNPFNKKEIKNKLKKHNFTDLISNQIKSVPVGECLMMDIAGKDIGTARMTIKHCSNNLKMKFSTKTSEGALWVKRVF